jgi:murein DD-endopeptidase MepM/ murein hydrolase activator NlpD
MGRDLDDLDEFPAEHDPVVRMPRRMAVSAPSPPGISLRVVTLVGVGGAALGAALGAMGIGIVVATVPPPSPPGPVAVVAPPVDAGPPPSFELRADASVLPPPVQGAAEFELVQQAIGRGRTLAMTLAAVGVERADAPGIIRALRGLVPMRSLRPSDRVVALREPTSHALLRVEFRRSATEVWAALRSTDGRWYGEALRLVASTARVSAGFRVQGDIEQSLRGAGLYPEALPLLAQALVVMDLPPRLVGGDIVRLVLEEERLNDAHQRYGQLLAVDLRGPRLRRRGIWSEAARDWFDPDGFTAERGALRSPVPGARVGAGFQPRRVHPVSHAPRPHLGLDLVAPAGTPVLAPAAGIVRHAAFDPASGNLVRLEHPTLFVQTGYAHLARFAPGVRVGARVRQGTVLGYVGSTGHSRAPHLHLTVRRRGALIDPAEVFAARRPIAASMRQGFAAIASNLGAALDQVRVDGEALVVTPAPPAPLAPPAGSPAPLPDPEGEETEVLW